MASSLRGEVQAPTLRQYEVLVAKVQFGTYAQTGLHLGIAARTVGNQLRSLRDYWGAHNTTHLTALVFRHVGDIFTLCSLVLVWEWIA